MFVRERWGGGGGLYVCATGCIGTDVDVEGQDENSDNYTCACYTGYQSY